MKVLVIIVSYNFEQWIDHCLGSLLRSEQPVDVLVIDNDSKDKTVERIRINYPDIRIIENHANLGFGQANNLGMQIALNEGYEFVFLMNQDAWIDPNTIHTLANLSQKHPEYGIFSPVHLTGKGDRLDPGFAHYSAIQAIKDLPLVDEILPLDFINAAFWMIPTSVLKKVGGFSPLFYHYGEDKDFVNRLHYHQYGLSYSPKVFGNHDREYRPVTYASFLRTEYVYHLSEYANINYSWIKAFGYGVMAILKKCIGSLLKRELSLCKDYFLMTFSLLLRTREINRYRKNNRLSYPHYI